MTKSNNIKPVNFIMRKQWSDSNRSCKNYINNENNDNNNNNINNNINNNNNNNNNNKNNDKIIKNIKIIK